MKDFYMVTNPLVKDTIKKVEYKLKPGYAAWFIKKLPDSLEKVEVKLLSKD